MTIYVILLIWLLISSYLEKCNKINKRINRLLYFNLFLCFFLSAFRDYSVGTDTNNYLYIFNNLSSQDVRGLEYSWFFLIKITSILNNYRLFIILVSFSTIYIIGKSIKLFSCNKNFALFLYVSFYFYFASMNIMRQMLAVAICLYAVKYIINRDIYKYIIIIIFAATIHTSSLCFIPLYLCGKISFNKPFLYAIVIASYICAPYAIYIASQILGLNDIYSMYLYTELNESGRSSIVLLIYSMLAIFLIYKSDTSNVFLKIFVIGVFFINFFAEIPVVARISFYFRIVLICLVGTINLDTSKITKQLFYFAIVTYAIGSCIIMIYNNSEGVYPYSFL